MNEPKAPTLTYTCPQCALDIKYSPGEDLFQLAIDHLPLCKRKRAAPSIKRITDVVPEEVLRGNLVTMEDILDREVLITEMTWHESSFKEDEDYISLTLDLEGEEKVLNTGAVRVVQVFKAITLEQLPIYARFEKIQLPNGRRVYRVC